MAKLIYGTIKGRGDTCYRLNTKTKMCEFILWRAGEHNHKVDYWHSMGIGWEQSFVAGYPTEVQKSDRLEF
jgi:hypothetical protein